jgi:hypothetical protein
MEIKLTVNYTDDEYLCAVREKVEQMPYKNAHTFIPFIIWISIIGLLNYFLLLDSWWGISLSLILALYAIPSLFGRYLAPYIGLLFARKQKLKETYNFLISSETISRSSQQDVIEVLWRDIKSIDVTTNNYFFNVANGSMLLPKSRFSNEQLQWLNETILAYNKAFRQNQK